MHHHDIIIASTFWSQTQASAGSNFKKKYRVELLVEKQWIRFHSHMETAMQFTH